MKDAFENSSSSYQMIGKASLRWIFSTRGMPLKVSIAGAGLALVASIGVSMAVGHPAEDAILKEQQLLVCKQMTGKTLAELNAMKAKCLEVHPRF